MSCCRLTKQSKTGQSGVSVQAVAQFRPAPGFLWFHFLFKTRRCRICVNTDQTEFMALFYSHIRCSDLFRRYSGNLPQFMNNVVKNISVFLWGFILLDAFISKRRARLTLTFVTESSDYLNLIGGSDNLRLLRFH